ncbi:MAG: Rrf2 family transcriptional regulator [Pyramidobacter sp.]|uniref:RrF2 family transcriptional regulator n=1 Tax=Pyramidobacter sp. TaxID=1943581 RepID=UPI002A824799|nr:Rrf2 family transcriptional regulator [Pyramidobacter sp.]MDY4032361.1 Rrf2 family transcriptional regulator [Pyramidobacter sp.]
MLVSTKGRYALRVLIDLAEHQTGDYVPLRAIAERQQISEKYLEAILKSLVRGKILTGMRGKGGGYKLAIAPEELTVGHILRLTEPALATVSCLTEHGEKCARREECRTLPMWQELDSMILAYLDGRKLAELTKKSGSGAGSI